MAPDFIGISRYPPGGGEYAPVAREAHTCPAYKARCVEGMNLHPEQYEYAPVLSLHSRRIAMNIQNYMEDVVQEELELLLSERNDICKCQKCKFDMMVWTLNRLPAKYVITNKGRLYTKLKEQEIQFKTDVVKELTKAIEYVGKNPQH